MKDTAPATVWRKRVATATFICLVLSFSRPNEECSGNDVLPLRLE